MTRSNLYQKGLEKNAANFAPLSPLSFIRRAADIYPHRLSMVHDDRRFTWAETYARCRRLASALRRMGISSSDTVSVMLPNVPAMYEAHFGVPMAGAVLNAINVRLDPDTIAFILRHSETKVLITDPEYSEVVGRALKLLGADAPS